MRIKMSSKVTCKNIDIVNINTAIENVKKVSLKDVIATMSTAKFYALQNTDKRSLSVLSIVANVVNVATTFDTFDDDDVDDAFKRALLLNAKELFCIAQRMTNHLNRDKLDAAKVEKLRIEHEKIAKQIAKYESKQNNAKASVE